MAHTRFLSAIRSSNYVVRITQFLHHFVWTWKTCRQVEPTTGKKTNTWSPSLKWRETDLRSKWSFIVICAFDNDSFAIAQAWCKRSRNLLTYSSTVVLEVVSEENMSSLSIFSGPLTVCPNTRSAGLTPNYPALLPLRQTKPRVCPRPSPC